MRNFLLIGLIMATLSIQARAQDQAQKDKDWSVYTEVDLFAYSEPVSIERFAKDFDQPLEEGDTAFTQDRIEVGARWRAWRIAYVYRFDYITRFTHDTAIVHHAEKNDIVIDQSRDYDLLLDVERVTARGIKLGYTWQANDDLSIDVAGSYYNDISDLQSGRATAFGDLEPITDELIADIDAFIDTLDSNNRDLDPLRELVQDVTANLLIDYAYDEPKFDEPFYRKPVVVGDPNPVISGVDFTAPGGTGYAFDVTVDWQVNDKLHLTLEAIDIVNKYEWENAPQTRATFDLNPALLDAIDVAQDFVLGEIVRPNDLVDRHVFVEIFNADFEQELPHRYRLSGSWALEREVDWFGWTPHISLLGTYYHTDSQDFPSIGVSFDDTFRFEYDLGVNAIAVGYQSQYLFVRVITDKLDVGDAYTFGFSMGFNVSF